MEHHFIKAYLADGMSKSQAAEVIAEHLEEMRQKLTKQKSLDVWKAVSPAFTATLTREIQSQELFALAKTGQPGDLDILDVAALPADWRSTNYAVRLIALPPAHFLHAIALSFRAHPRGRGMVHRDKLATSVISLFDLGLDCKLPRYGYRGHEEGLIQKTTKEELHAALLAQDSKGKRLAALLAPYPQHWASFSPIEYLQPTYHFPFNMNREQVGTYIANSLGLPAHEVWENWPEDQ